MKITKAQLKDLIREAAAEYVWGIKGPARVANQYSLKTFKITKKQLKQIIKEELGRLDPFAEGQSLLDEVIAELDAQRRRRMGRDEQLFRGLLDQLQAAKSKIELGCRNMEGV